MSRSLKAKKSGKRSPKKSSKRASPKRSSGSPSLNTRIFTASMFVNSAERPKFKAWATKNRSKLHPSMPPSKIISLYKRSKKIRGGHSAHSAQSAPSAQIEAGLLGLSSLETGLGVGVLSGLATNNKGLGVTLGLGAYAADRLLNQNARGGCGCGK